MQASVDTNSPQSLYNLWNAASVVLGFQFVAFFWRMTQERKMESNNEPTWLPVADKLNIVSMGVIILGTFVAPIFRIGVIHPDVSFAVGLLMLSLYPPALAAHYRLLFKGWKEKNYLPTQERSFVVLCAALVLLVVALRFHSRLGYIAAGVLLLCLLPPWFSCHQEKLKSEKKLKSEAARPRP